MGLYEIEHPNRIVFLKKFTEELITSCYKKQRENLIIESEKIKQKYIEPKISPDEAFKKIIRNPIMIQKDIQDDKEEKILEEIPSNEKLIPSNFDSNKNPELTNKILKKPELKIHNEYRPIKNIAQNQITRPIEPLRPFIKKNIKSYKRYIPKKGNFQIPPQSQITPQIQTLSEVSPEAMPRPPGFNLGKLELFLKDPGIQMIECKGPGTNLFVKKYNQIKTTNSVLTEPEINDIINKFAVFAKIPIMGNIFKAAVGDLIISAVLSDLIGSRFIINRMTSYSMIQK